MDSASIRCLELLQHILALTKIVYIVCSAMGSQNLGPVKWWDTLNLKEKKLRSACKKHITNVEEEM